MSNHMTEIMAEAIEAKHRQLCLARKGLFSAIRKAIPPAKTEQGAYDNADKWLDEVINGAVAVDLLRCELERMERSAEKATHAMNMEKVFFDMLSGLKSGSKEKEE